ncbi:cytochrome family 51 (sterol 14-demethylase) [Fusarium albosuccineum]|uniref:Cytochrome family 51 (Sterol 14-demethylase) n=1 Tax=Fusarium albosuccineum TaxID=1237068 RepID=A0A8H4L7B6_9HYPO|nr:cytochrome family 51 (sterol 14-demethylase) [Fusarium albosuccineum]
MSLPLKAKVSIRDNWTKPDCPAQNAIKNLKEVLGLQIYCEPEWPILVSELGNVWEDKSQLVASVVSFLQTWFQTLTELLEDSTQEEWADTLLNRINELCSRLNLIVEVSETQKASTVWSDARLGFVLYLPNTQVFQPAQFSGIFKEQLLDCFVEKKTTTSIPIHSTTGDEWADVRAEDVSEKAVKQRPAKSEAPVIEYLPDPNTMPKPGTLLQRVPYHLFVCSSGKNRIEIECSHSQTLEVLSEYLKRWCRINPNITTKPPAVDIELNHGTSGFGVVCDRLTLFCENRYGGIFTVSPTMILNLVEGVFGYERVYGDSHSWHYRRDTPFKQL